MTNKTQTVLITGASSGIGLDVAKGFLETGANVALNARNSEKLAAVAQELGDPSRIALVPGDIGQKETGEKIVHTAVERFGRADVLINNAGIFGRNLLRYPGRCAADEETGRRPYRQYRHRADHASDGQFARKRRADHQRRRARPDHQPGG